VEEKVIDYVGGLKDIKARRLRNVIPLERIFSEDPVRMIRAVKYACTTGFKLPGKLKRSIKRSSDLLAETPYSRMTEELFKILLSGFSSEVITVCIDFRLFRHMLPEFRQLMDREGTFRDELLERLADLDAEVREAGEDRRARAIAYLCADYLFRHTPLGEMPRIPFADGYGEIKRVIKPIVPANKEVEMALVYLIRRRKTYIRTGKLEVTPPSERVRVEDEPWHHADEAEAAKRKKKRRRSRRPRSKSSSSSKQ
jgi:poly(A) polymerase